MKRFLFVCLLSLLIQNVFLFSIRANDTFPLEEEEYYTAEYYTTEDL
jgi:hypothetical protein